MRAFIDFPGKRPFGADLTQPSRWQAHFAAPLAVLTAWHLDEVQGVLQQVQTQARAGRWCVGELAYEAAPAFDAALATHSACPGWPLARFAVFDLVLPWPRTAIAKDHRSALRLMQLLNGALAAPATTTPPGLPACAAPSPVATRPGSTGANSRC